jgi:hypothetical protein
MDTPQLYRSLNFKSVLSILDSLDETLDNLEVSGDAGRVELEAELRKCINACLDRLIPSNTILFYAHKYHIDLSGFGSKHPDLAYLVERWRWECGDYKMEEFFYIFTKPKKTKRCRPYSKP